MHAQKRTSVCRRGSGRPMARRLAWLFVGALAVAASRVEAGEPRPWDDLMNWNAIASLPDREGFAGMFAGVHNGALIAGGGAHFPDLKPWEGGTKVWHDTVFVLERPDGEWRRRGRLPRRLAYGVSATDRSGVICAGGADAEKHYAEVFRLCWEQGTLQSVPLPPLPRPCANMAGAILGGVLYVAGGIDEPNATAALATFWALDLGRRDLGWRELEPWPGPGRMLATAGVVDGSFFLFGGTALHAGADGKPQRDYLHDAYRFTPGRGWKRIADPPRATAAAPSPAPAIGQSHLLVIGGDDGEQLGVAPTQHRGFPRGVLAYHAITDTWLEVGEAPFSLVTTPTAEWDGRTVIVSGEARPGVRSPEVWSLKIEKRKAEFGLFNYAVLGGYLLAMVGIGAALMRGNRDTDDYFRGGRQIPWWAAGLSIFATMLSSLTFMAIPAKAYATNWTYIWINVSILLLAPLVIGCYLPHFRRQNLTSAYEYLERRFNLATRLYGSGAFLLFHLGRMAIVLYLPSLALAAVSNLDVRLCIVLMGALCVVYTALGGIKAVVWTDVVQTFVLLGGAVLSLIVIVAAAGGPSALWTVAAGAEKFQMVNAALDPREAADAFWVVLLGGAFGNLGPYTSDQAVVQRYLTTPDEALAARAIWLNAILAIPVGAVFFGVGTALFVFYRLHPARLDPTLATDAIFPAFIVNDLPAGVAGLVIAGIFAAAQSTVSGSLNSSVTAIMTDFYGRLGGRAEGARGLWLARGATMLLGLAATAAALALAECDVKSLWDVYNTLLGLVASGLAGLFALGVFTRRANGRSALLGAAASAVALCFVQRYTEIHFMLYAAIGFCVSFGIGWLAGGSSGEASAARG